MSGGFFETEDISAPRPKKRRRIAGCANCGLDKTCNSPMMEMSGKGLKNILVIAEAPGEEEDKVGEQLVGPVGQLLAKKMKRNDLDLHKDCWKINAVNCRPPKNRTPTPKEIECCRARVWRAIEDTKPKAIFLFGGPAVESFLAHRWTGDEESLGGITKWSGWKIPDKEVGAWVFPMYHPSYVKRMEGTTVELDFDFDLKVAIDIALNGPVLPSSEDLPKVTCIKKEEEAATKLKLLCHFPTASYVAFDYETTGLKPQREGHKIVCVGFSYGKDEAFTVLPNSVRIKRYLRVILRSEQIKKIAQNMKFEAAWSKELLGVWPRGVVWDTMLASHVLNNRAGITGLKFQTYVQFGYLGYDSEIAPYLKGVEKKNANAFNNIHQANINKVMQYCGLDALFTYRLATYQFNAMERLQKWQERKKDLTT